MRKSYNSKCLGRGILRSAILPLSMLVLFLAPAMLEAQAPTFKGTELSNKSNSTLEESFEKFTVVDFELDNFNDYIHPKYEMQQSSKDVHLQLGDYDWVFTMTPTEIRSDDFHLMTVENGQLIEIPAGHIKTYSGYLKGSSQEVRMTLDDGFLSGVVYSGGQQIYVEQLNRYMPSAPANQLVIYSSLDVKDSSIECGYNEAKNKVEELIDQTAGLLKIDLCYQVKLGIASDASVFTTIGAGVAGVNNFTTAVINNIQPLYRLTFADNVEFLIGAQFVSQLLANDPFSPNSGTTDASVLLGEFGAWMVAGTPGFGMTVDLGQVWVTRNITLGGTPAAGVAATPGVCQTPAQRRQVIKYSGPGAAGYACLVAHETGHNFNASHETGFPNIMGPSCGPLVWHPNTVTEINNHLGSGSCTGGANALTACATPPVAKIGGAAAGCVGTTLTFKDESQFGATRVWTMTGGTPAMGTNAMQNVVYGTAGMFNVSLTATNAAGSNTTSTTVFIGAGPAAICPPAPNTGQGAGGISSFGFSNMLKTSPSGAALNAKLEDFSCTDVAKLDKSTLYVFTSLAIDCGGGTQSWKMYIDYNNDGDFADPGEEVMTSMGIAACGEITGFGGFPIGAKSFTTPASPVEDQLLRARIIVDQGTVSGPCHNPTVGQIEDYSVVFMGVVTCTPPVVTAPTVTQPTCALPTGTIVVNATGGGTLEYSVDNGTSWQASNTFATLAAGNYNIKVRLQADPTCMTTYATNPVVLNAPTGCCTAPVVTAPTVTQPTCATPTGTIVVNATGTGTLEYSVDNGASWQLSNTFSGLNPGNYNIKVRLQADPSCMAAYGANPVVLNAPTGCCTPPVVTAPTVTQPTCATPTGTIVVNATGGGTLEYSVDNGASWQASNTFTTLAAGSYNIKVRLQADPTCMAAYGANPVVLNAPTGCCTPPVVTAPTVTQPTCATPTGTIVVNATGGGSLEYSVDNGASWQASNTFSGLNPGNYNIKVRLQADPSCMATYGMNPVVLNAATACCSITAITVANISACNNNGTPANPGDDFFTADVTVTYSNPTGTALALSGDGTANVAIGMLGGPTSHTFTGVQMSADGGTISLTAAFTGATPPCMFTNPAAGTAPASCSVPPSCMVTAINVTNMSACNDNGTSTNPLDDFFTADVTVVYVNPSGTALALTGDGTANVAFGMLGSMTSHTFVGVQMSADGGAIALTAAFTGSAPPCGFMNPAAATAPAACSMPPSCMITAINTSNISACNNNGTPGNTADDFFTADVTVVYVNPPATGTLALTGDGAAVVGVAMAGATSHTFVGVQMSADGTPINLTATFSVGTCTFNNPAAGTSPVSCSTTGGAPTISQTDIDGDGNPDITDPCACGDPQNIIDGGGNVTHFHDFVTINSGPGENWTLQSINSGQMLTIGLAGIPLGTVIPEGPAGVYRLDLWHPVGVGFNATFTNGVANLTTGGTCNACPVMGIPTMGEWGLIILALLLLSFATVFMMRRQTALAGVGNVSAQSSGIPFDRAAFGEMLAYVMIGLAATFTIAIAAFGYETTSADIPGILIAGPVLAYLIHLMGSFKKG